MADKVQRAAHDQRPAQPRRHVAGALSSAASGSPIVAAPAPHSAARRSAASELCAARHARRDDRRTGQCASQRLEHARLPVVGHDGHQQRGRTGARAVAAACVAPSPVLRRHAGCARHRAACRAAREGASAPADPASALRRTRRKRWARDRARCPLRPSESRIRHATRGIGRLVRPEQADVAMARRSVTGGACRRGRCPRQAAARPRRAARRRVRRDHG